MAPSNPRAPTHRTPSTRIALGRRAKRAVVGLSGRRPTLVGGHGGDGE
jgi:hypothetical protein